MAAIVSALAGTGLALAVSTGVWMTGPDRPTAARSDEEPARSRDAGVLDERVLLFREDEDPTRVVAEVTATLLRGDDGVRLRIVASAVGASVDPAPGYEGVAGSNRIAAEEMGALVRRGGLTIDSGRLCGEPRVRGTVVEANRSPLLERSLDARGVVRHVESRDALCLATTLETLRLPRGSSLVEIQSDGRVRVRATVSVQAAGGSIVALDEWDGRGARLEFP